MRWPWVAVLIVLLFTSAVRLRLLDVPLERDEGEYAYAGQLILFGVPPYRLVYNMKLPGTYAAYAAIMAGFGQTPRGIHLGLLLVNAATVVLLFLLGRRLFDGRTGVIASAAFALLSLSQGVYGVFAHATHFVVLPAVAGALLLTRVIDAGPVPERSGWLTPLGSGALFGAAFVMKQHGIFFVLFGAAWLAWELARRGALPAKIAARCGTLLLGAALPFLLTCGLLAWAGVFKDFWFWTFDYARAYVSEVPLSLGVQIFREAVLRVAAPVFPLWVLAAMGLTAPLWDGRARARWPFIAAFTVSSFLALCPGLYFRPHYFVLILPAFALLAGIAVSAAGRAAGRWSRADLVLVLVSAAALLYPVYQERSFFFRMTPRQASRMTYGVNPFPEAPEIARRLAADTTTDDRIAILGSEPEIFFYSGRRSATGYIYMYGLMESQPYAHDMQQAAIQEIEASAPKYVVFVDIPWSWLGRPESDTSVLTWSKSYLKEHYQVAGVADIVSDDSTVYVWGEEAIRYTPQSPYVIYIFKRTS